MVALPWRTSPLTPKQERDFFMLTLEDDTEESPWMVMGDLQFWSASSFAHSLRSYGRDEQRGWYVASMLPITYTWGGSNRKRVLAPDTFVAFASDHLRQSFDVAAEGGFPPFVLEVVSPSSVARDEEEKREAYDFLEAREYALFTPRTGTDSALTGYRRDAAGAFVHWLPDSEGRLWSEVLGLFLVVRGATLQAQSADGRLLLTPEQMKLALSEAEAARRESEIARQRAEVAQQQADLARQRAEEEAERLRRELARLRGENGGV